MHKRLLFVALLGLVLVGSSWYGLREITTRAWEARRATLIALAEPGPSARRPWELHFESLVTRLGGERYRALRDSQHRPYVACGDGQARALTIEERLWIEAATTELAGLEGVLADVRRLELGRANWGGEGTKLYDLREFAVLLAGRAWLAHESGDGAGAAQSYADGLRLLAAVDPGTSWQVMTQAACESILLAGLRSALSDGLDPRAVRAELEPTLAAMDYDPARAERRIRRDLAYLERAPADEWGGAAAALSYFKPVEEALACAGRPLKSMPWVAASKAAGLTDGPELERERDLVWFQGVCGLQYRSERARVTRLALALGDFHASAGRWPAELAELDVPVELRRDPLTGQDVAYSSEGDLAVLGPSAWGEHVDRWERLDESPYLWVLRSSSPSARE